MNSASVMAIPPLNSDKVNLEPSMEIPSIWHKWCLYRAFDGKGNYIPPELRQTDTKSSTTFLKNGLHPMSVCSTVLSSGMIGLGATLSKPFKAAYNSAIESYSSFSYAISILFLIDTKINLITPLKPRKSDIASQGKRLPLRDWAYQYITSKDMPIDVISMVILLRISVGIGLIMSRIIPIGGLFIVFMHFQACTLYYVGFLEKFHTWNNQFDHWKYYSGGIEAATQEDAYIWLLTQAIGNTFSMNFKPETMSEQVVNIAFIVFGAILYALLVGLLSSAAIAYDSSGRLYRQKIDELNEYLNWKRIDPATKKKVLSYYEFKYRGKYFEEQTLLADMNNSLRMCITLPGDFVFHQGENAMEMFFIQTGKVNIIVNGKVVAFGNAGSFFGEVALIANIPRTASIQAAAACTLYSLSSRDFVAIINEFEDMKERIDLIYQDRMEKVRKEKEGKLKVLK
ncbi:cyclic nucleotide-binding-like protein [Obelidium mucronatum]|nr:cyclic nucleotide-binding-like protein [Obelidium mucronatum]